MLVTRQLVKTELTCKDLPTLAQQMYGVYVRAPVECVNDFITRAWLLIRRRRWRDYLKSHL